jgi:hypothetical protein
MHYCETCPGCKLISEKHVITTAMVLQDLQYVPSVGAVVRLKNESVEGATPTSNACGDVGLELC